MEKTNQRESVSCYARNRNHYIKWCLIYGLIMSFTFPPGVAMLFYAQFFNWVSWVLTLVGALCLYKLLTGLLSIFNHYYGCAVEKDYAKAAFWYQKGVDENEFWCYPKLGICYRNGWGVQKDVDYAFRLLCMAENEIDEYSDNARGLIWNTLGNMYAYGDGVAEDIKRGVEYYQKAIAVGNENAESNIQDFKKNIFGKWKRR